jgi:feruloyl esterase
MAPGMSHCYGGPGPAIFGGARTGGAQPLLPSGDFDPEHKVFSALDHWVEHGRAPDQIITSHIANGAVDRTRKLCPYPQVARWKGAGSTDDARNFVCVEPQQ